MKEREESQSRDFSENVLLPVDGVDKENPVVEIEEKSRDLEQEFHDWINGGKVVEEDSVVEEKEKGKSPQNIISAINFLKQNSFRVAFNEYGRSSDLIRDTITKTIENIKKDNNYFIDAKLKQIEQKPLDNDKWPLSMRKALLKAEIGNIKHDNIVDNSLVVKLKDGLLSDKEVDYVFNAYREFNPEYFYWLENHDRRDDYHDQSLVNGYNIIPKIAEDSYDKLQITRDCCYSKMSKKYAAIYTPKGNIDSFFQVDQKVSLEDKEIEQKNGNIKEGNLEYFLNKFKKDIECGNSGKLHYYLQIRKDLPEEISKDIDEELSLFIPEKLDKHFDSIDEFEKAITYSGNEIEEYFSKLDKEKQEYLVSSLKSLLDRRKEEAGEKYFGFCSEDIETLDFYKSFMKRNPNNIKPYAHFSICYYLYLRKDLPEDLVSDFEEKFSIEIPDKFKSFNNQDDYLKISDKDLLEPFKKPFKQKIEGIDEEVLSTDFIKMQEYLYEKIDELDQKIKNAKIQPERLDINEVLTKEGFNKNDVKEKDYNRLVSVYKTLIELPMREKIENEFGIELKDFNIREQVQFVNFLSSKSIEEVGEVKEFLNQGEDEEAKNNRIKVFLSLESGKKEMGENILKIGEKIDAEGANAIFAKYAEIIKLTEKTREDLEEIFKDKKNVSEEEREKIVQNLISKGSQLLVDFSDKAERKKGKAGSASVLKELEKAKIDLMFMASFLKVLKKEGKRNDIDIENFNGVTFEKRTVSDLTNGGEIMDIIDNICAEAGVENIAKLSESSVNNFFRNRDSDIDENDKNKIKNVIGMIKIYHDNYADNQKMQEKLVEDFENMMREGRDSTTIFALLKGGMPYAFCRFDNLGNEEMYAASLNVSPKMQGSAIGEAFFEKCMEENKKYTIFGDCSLIKPLVCTHIEKNGFVAKKVFDFSGELSVKIEKPGENKKTYEYKGFTKEEIINRYENEFLGNKYDKNSSKFILKFEDRSKNLYSAIENLLNNEHYVLTRYFAGDGKDQNGKREFYCAFERGES